MIKPQERKYLEVKYFDMSNAIDNDSFQIFVETINSHHCQMAVKESSFVFEEFFSPQSPASKVLENYLLCFGYELEDGYLEYEDSPSMIKGYDGILIKWTW